MLSSDHMTSCSPSPPTSARSSLQELTEYNSMQPQPEAELPRHDSSSLDHTNIDQSSLDRGSRDPANPDNESRDDNLTHDPRSLDHLDPTQQHHHHQQQQQHQRDQQLTCQSSEVMVQELGCYEPSPAMFHSRPPIQPGTPGYPGAAHQTAYAPPTYHTPPQQQPQHQQQQQQQQPQYVSLDQFQYQSQLSQLSSSDNCQPSSWPYPTPSPAVRSPDWYETPPPPPPPHGTSYHNGFLPHHHHQHHLQHNQSQQQSSVPPQTSLPLPHIASGQLTNQLLAGVPGCLAPGLQLNHSRSGASPELPLGNYANVPSVETSPSQTQDPRSPSITGRPPYDWMKKQAFQSQLSSDAESTEASGFKSGQKKTRTKDKYRIVYSEYQKIELEKEYLYSKYITIQRKSELSRSITLSERQVKIWFQNRRAKERKQKRKRDDVITPPDTPTKMPCMDGSSGIPHSEHMGEPPISMHLGESMIPPPLLQQQQHTQQPPHLGQVPPSSLHHHALSHQQQQMLPHPSVSLGALITQTPAMSILPHHVPLTPVTPSSNPSPAIKNEMIMQDVHCQSLRMPVH